MVDIRPGNLRVLPDEAIPLVRRRIEEEHGYVSWLNARVRTVERGRIDITIPFDEKLTTSDGETIHGGVAVTLADTVGGLVQRTFL